MKLSGTFICLLLSLWLFPQKKYIVGPYEFDPQNKIISVYSETGGVNWDGFTYKKIPDIDYDKISLVFLNDRCFLSKSLPAVKDSDYHKDTLISPKGMVFDLEGSEFLILKKDKTVDPVKYSKQEEYFYRNAKHELFFYDAYSGSLQKVYSPIDIKHYNRFAFYFFYNDTALYYFERQDATGTFRFRKIAAKKSNEPLRASGHYLVFGNRVFTGEIPGKTLQLDPGRIMETDLSWDGSRSVITDGKNFYERENSLYRPQPVNHFYYADSFFTSGKRIQRIISGLHCFYSVSDSAKIYVANEAKVKNTDISQNSVDSRMVLANGTPYLLPSDGKPVKIRQVMILNSSSGSYEDLDFSQLKILNFDYFVYREKLYFRGNPVLSEGISCKALYKIKNTDYLTDGKSTIYAGSSYGYQGYHKDGIFYMIRKDIISENTYTGDTRSYGKDLLVNDRYIVFRGNTIPIEELGITVYQTKKK